MNQGKAKSEHERITSLEGQMKEVAGVLEKIERTLQRLEESGIPPSYETATDALSITPSISSEACLKLPLFDKQQVLEAQKLFKGLSRDTCKKVQDSL